MRLMNSSHLKYNYTLCYREHNSHKRLIKLIPPRLCPYYNVHKRLIEKSHRGYNYNRCLKSSCPAGVHENQSH